MGGAFFFLLLLLPLFRPLIGLAEKFPLFSVSIFLTQLVWNVQMFPFGNGRPSLFTLKKKECERRSAAQSYRPQLVGSCFEFSVKLASVELFENRAVV